MAAFADPIQPCRERERESERESRHQTGNEHRPSCLWGRRQGALALKYIYIYMIMIINIYIYIYMIIYGLSYCECWYPIKRNTVELAAWPQIPMSPAAEPAPVLSTLGRQRPTSQGCTTTDRPEAPWNRRTPKKKHDRIDCYMTSHRRIEAKTIKNH